MRKVSCYVKGCKKEISDLEFLTQTGNVYLCDKHLNEHYQNNKQHYMENEDAINAKPIRRLAQFDCFIHAEEDDVTHPDRDGDALWFGKQTEPRNSDSIRLSYPIEINPFDVLRALNKISDWIKREMVTAYKKQ